MAAIERDLRGGIATLTLNDPDRRNAIGPAMAAELAEVVGELAGDERVHCLIVTGAGSAFCAGANLAELPAADEASLRAIYRTFTSVRDFPLPTIAAVNGPAVGAGVNLALSCDVRFAARSARFDTRFLRLGLHPGGGHTWAMNRAVGHQATAALTLFGESVDGQQAERIGLAWRCCEDWRLLEEAREFAGHVVAAPRQLVERVKRTLGEVGSVPDADSALEAELTAQLWSLRQESFAPHVVR